MTAIDCLPNNVLIQILSYLSEHELLAIDSVCLKWKLLIQTNVWEKMTCISQKSIGIGYGNFVENFIEMVDRVSSVDNLFILYSIANWTAHDKKRKSELREAIVKLVRKRTPDAVFYLAWIEDLVFFEHPDGVSAGGSKKQLRSKVRDAVAKVIDSFQLYNIETIGLINLDVQSIDKEKDEFTIGLHGVKVPLSIDMSKFTRLCIQFMAIRVAFMDICASLSAGDHYDRFCHFPQLQTVEIENVKLYVPSSQKCEESSMSLMLNFRRSNRVQFTYREFIIFLDRMRLMEDSSRNDQLFYYLDKWKRSQSIRHGTLTIFSREFHRIEALLHSRCKPSDGPPQDPVDAFLDCVFPALVTCLRLNITTDCNTEERLISLLAEQGVLSRLEEFFVTVLDVSFHRTDYVVDWKQMIGNQRMHRFLSFMGDHVKLANAEKLKFSFSPAHEVIVNYRFKPAAEESVTDLVELTYQGLPCFSFFLLAVTHTPYLRHLQFITKPFNSEGECFEFIVKLLDLLSGQRCLRTLELSVLRETREEYQGENDLRVIGVRERSCEEMVNLVAAVDDKTKMLTSILPQLYSVNVSIHSPSYCFKWGRALTNSTQGIPL